MANLTISSTTGWIHGGAGKAMIRISTVFSNLGSNDSVGEYASKFYCTLSARNLLPADLHNKTQYQVFSLKIIAPCLLYRFPKVSQWYSYSVPNVTPQHFYELSPNCFIFPQVQYQGRHTLLILVELVPYGTD